MDFLRIALRFLSGFLHSDWRRWIWVATELGKLVFNGLIDLVYLITFLGFLDWYLGQARCNFFVCQTGESQRRGHIELGVLRCWENETDILKFFTLLTDLSSWLLFEVVDRFLFTVLVEFLHLFHALSIYIVFFLKCLCFGYARVCIN